MCKLYVNQSMRMYLFVNSFPITVPLFHIVFGGPADLQYSYNIVLISIEIIALNKASLKLFRCTKKRRRGGCHHNAQG